jgi:hypothetical protein
MKHKGQPPPDPSTVTPQVPTELSLIILKCLAKDKGARNRLKKPGRAARPSGAGIDPSS